MQDHKPVGKIIPFEDDVLPKDRRDRGLFTFEQLKYETPFQRIGSMLLAMGVLAIGLTWTWLLWSKRHEYDTIGFVFALIGALAFLSYGVLYSHSGLIYYVRKIRAPKDSSCSHQR